MPDYRRIVIPESLVFFTVVTYKRQPFLTTSQTRQSLRIAWRHVVHHRPFELIALVLLPDHLHCIWKMPKTDPDFSTRWGQIKRHFSKLFRQKCSTIVSISESMKYRREAGIWQRRFWDHVIRDEHDFENHMNYIHYNPVKHGLASKPSEWPWSTFHKYVRMGIYDMDWGNNGFDLSNDISYGEL